jgi:molybdopterin-guanine dinucleotide biosynthesis protein A
MGRPKALLPHPHGGTFLEYMVHVASAVTGRVVLLGDLPNCPNISSVAAKLGDPVADSGPMGGLLSLLQYAKSDWVLLISCDMPLLTPSVLRDLLGRGGPDVDVVAFERQDGKRGLHPCCTAYHTRVLDVASNQLSTNKRMHELLAKLRTRILHPTESQRRSLFNVNTPDDLARLHQSSG